MCGRTITPVYKSLQTLLSDDVEHVAHLLSELEPFCHDDMIDDEHSRRPTLPPPLPCSTTTTSRQCNNDIRKDISSHTYPRRRRRQASTPIDHPLIILSTHCSIPMIIITPCLPQPHDSMSRPPFQDSSFGDRLTLPRSYPVFNDVFPPLLPTPHPPLPAVEKWRWVDGHWRAVLPTLEEQRRQGLFSRYVMAKRKGGGYRAGTSPRAC
jgi:hypothetical protein